MAVRFEIVKTRGEKKWHARIKSAGNNETLFWTQDYASKASARYACQLIKSGAAAAIIPSTSIKEDDDSPVIA